MRGIHGHGFVGVAHTGEQEFRKTCRENMLRRVEWLKIFVTAGTPPIENDFIPSFISLEEIETVTGEAKRMGIHTSAHCIGGEGLVNCVKGGIDVIDHAYCATDRDLELIAKNNRFICLTPSVFMDSERNKANTQALMANIEKSRDRVIKVMEKIVTSGVKYAIGSDALHAHMPLEAKYAVELGATAHTALMGVTIKAARLCAADAQLGSLTAGKYADIIAVLGNPLKKIEDLARVAFIMKDGKRYM
jgi:imidazolonepropionase-like amidohydrolase